ncbi:MAG: hypothetical protein RLZZ225_588 [Pseudomonadota bacterium]|jgi:hypothetical protein
MPKEKSVFKFSVLPFVLLSCCAWVGKAQAGGYLPPRLSIDANAGGSATVGQADLLLSLKGDERRNLYLDPQAAYGTDEQWYTDLGLGYRWIQNDAAILGGYIFAGHSQVANQNGFWIANPGVEALGSRWDARINGYIPIGSRNDDMGVFPFVQSSRFSFTGHTESLVTTYVNGDESQQIGDGIDARVGYQVLRGLPLKAYLGAYYFSIPHTNNVRGGAAGLEYWFDHKVKVFANYTYDNLQHNTVVGGLAVSFGGVDESRADPSLSERLTDPVERYLANLGHGSGIPSETMLTNMQTGVESVLNASSINNLLNTPMPSGGPPGRGGGTSSTVINTSMAFFAPGGGPNNGGNNLTIANCTFESPCGPNDFTQVGVNSLNSLLPSTQIFFNSGGTYNAANGAAAMTLNNGQGIFGVTANAQAQALGAARPTFNGAFILSGNNTLDSIILNNTLGAAATAITSTGGQNIIIRNSLIGTPTIPYGVGMNLTNASATMQSSVLNTSASVVTSISIPIGTQTTSVQAGIFLSGSSLVVQSSNISVVGSSSAALTGILAINGSSLQLMNNSSLSATNNSTLSNPVFLAQAVTVINNSMAIIDNSQINVTSPAIQSEGITALQAFNTSLIVMNSGRISLTGSGDNSNFFGFGNVVVSPGVICTENGMTYECFVG